jgi:hypothetical protein
MKARARYRETPLKGHRKQARLEVIRKMNPEDLSFVSVNNQLKPLKLDVGPGNQSLLYKLIQEVKVEKNLPSKKGKSTKGITQEMRIEFIKDAAIKCGGFKYLKDIIELIEEARRIY